MNDDIVNYQNEITNYKSILEQYQKKYSNINSNNQFLNKYIESKQQFRLKAYGKIVDLLSELMQKQNYINKLKNQIDDLSSGSETQIDSLNNKISQLEKEIKQLNSNITDLENRLTSCNEENNNLKNKIKNLTQMLNDSKQSGEECSIKQQKEINQLKQELNDLVSKYAQLEQEIIEITKATDQENNELNSFLKSN